MASSFLVGETVHLVSRISRPGTKVPEDPDVVRLTALRLNGVTEVLEAGMDFTRSKTGEYTLALSTTNLVPGLYEIIVTHSSGLDRVALTKDEFVLAPA